ncbi:multicopper oxidase [Aaosphaeria arxii CBS 175.79]|uniref:Multicopper oxidase n=1 Tax=Aaosphaeria arxii CBS 175.79 TaxID=1450172 RepID=A0A6A5Y8N7_9PLEO|nr:multicopper oxidase [Aaosphaeria arxii CBS 175.79]KAF2021768.1 multicopper oxidase [Aaosphaeria arxii CBS 175.79]
MLEVAPVHVNRNACLIGRTWHPLDSGGKVNERISDECMPGLVREADGGDHIATVLFISSLVGGLIAHITWPRDHTPSGPRLRPEEDYILDPHWDFNAKPSTREYHWTIAEHELNPDGVYRDMILINGMFPGPLIECNEGDEIVVHVSNRGSNATSIHWHGLFQNGTNWMDGTVGVTQCPIAPGRDFTYRFNVSRQTGTYWYHSHMSMQASDGVVGPIVIHSRKEEELQKIPYAEDRVVLVSDHYYDLSSDLMMDYLAPDRENDEPVPPAAVINGRQQRDCATVPNRRCDSSNRKRALFDLASHHNTRLRFINVGAFAEFQIQIDEHEFYVSEVDGTDVMPQAIHRLNINPAQRYSIIVVPPKSNKGLYWLRARMVTHCFAYEEPELQEEVWGVVRYWGSDDAPTPSSKDWPEVIELECKDLNTSLLSPVIPQRAPAHVDDQIYLRSTFQIKDWALSRGYLNDSSHHVSAANPVLNRLYEPSTKPSSFADSLSTAPPVGINTALSDPKTDGLVYQTTGIRTLDILVQNFDDGNHPFHLHGHTFWVLATGHGYPPPPADLYSPGHLDLENPLRRDTASVEAYGWTLIRFVADNPGVWAFHCHIGWHAEAGLAMQFLARADVILVLCLCLGWGFM